MQEIPVSPPKVQRKFLQDITLTEGNYYGQRNTNSIKKKLNIEQENFDTSNFLCESSFKKINFGNKKSPIGFHLEPKLSCFKVQQNNIMSLPSEVHFEILKYLAPQDLIKNIQYVSKTWYKISNDTRLWEALDKFQKLDVDLKYLKKQCVVERRSKGKLFRAVSRLDHTTIMIRKINLAVANAGFDDGLPTSILREISYLSSIDHVNVSKIKEIETQKDAIQICSEYHDYSLKEYMKLHLFKTDSQRSAKISYRKFEIPFSSDHKDSLAEYRIPLRNIKVIAYQILKGLCCIHHQGFIHRNIKPDNIFINRNGDIKIGDFGLSRLITVPHIPYTPEDPKDRERSGREARRLWYRAPELLLRKTIYSFEIDIWSFGCLLAELAQNEPLFNGETEIEQLFKIFRLIGSPNDSNWNSVSDNLDFRLSFPKWENGYFSYVCYNEQSQEYQFLHKLLVPSREKAFKKLQALGDILGGDGLDLLWNCLMLNPQLRPHASVLLNHQFFDEIREEAELRYVGVTCCKHRLCENSGFYTIPDMLDCHLVSYFQAMKANEADFIPTPDYLNQQAIITEHMRCILVDWLIDVSVHFDVQNETLHYCVNYIDRVLSKMKIDRSKLQLIGVSSMKIADVCHERSKEYYKQENANEYAYITADEYSADQLIEIEKEILNLLGFKLNTPTSIHFLKIYITLLQIPEQITVVAMFLVDLMLMGYQILEFDYSLVASAALFLACKCGEYTVDQEKLATFREYLDLHSQKSFEKCVMTMKSIWTMMKTTPNYINFDAVYNKYQIQFNLLGRTLTPPTYSQIDLEDWFYTKP